MFEFTQAYREYGYPTGDALPEIRWNVDLKLTGDNTTLRRSSTSEEFRLIRHHLSAEDTNGLHIENITFKNGYYGNGAAIFASNNLTLTNCVFEDNVSPFASGAIYTLGSRIFIQDCDFINNQALDGSYGALYLPNNDYVTIQNCTFDNNSASDSYSVLYMTATVSGLIEDCTFINNVARYQGACIFYGQDIIIRDCLFQNNQTTELNSGITPAALYTYASNSETRLIEGCEFFNNVSASSAGAIYVGGDNIIVRDCAFAGNIASDEGGAVYYSADPNGSGNIKFNHCQFETNQTLNDPSGAIIASSNGNLADFRFSYWGAADGPSGAGTGAGQAIPSSVLYKPFVGVTKPVEHKCEVWCPVCYDADGKVISPYPVDLKTGEKRLNETDLILSTPMGSLAFTRKYHQNQQSDLEFMGLGWSHNLRYSLVEDVPNNKLTIQIAGTQIIFYDDNADDIFEAAAGSTSVVVKDVSGTYDLTASDESVYHFDSTGQVLTHTLTTGDVWSFSYDVNDNLIEISDGYGRALKLAYYSGLSGADAFKNGQLWRVGTHASTDLVNTPQTPYVEYDYVDDGSGQALLTDVQDVRGEVWQYRYYGSEAGETDPKWTNFLVETFSPSVDSNGDGTVDGNIQLQELSYTGTARDDISQIVQSRGDALVSTTVDFDPANDVTTETRAGLVTTHRFTNGVYLGSEDDDANNQEQVPLSNYRTAYQLGPNHSK